MESADWSNIPGDIGYVILCNLTELVDHIWFGAVCKNWYSFVKEYNQLNRHFRGTLPMYFVPVNECKTQRRFVSMIPNNHQPSNVTLSNIPNKRCCGSSYGWLAFMEKDLSVTLINPFNFKGVTIHLPALKTESSKPYYYTISKLILPPESTPDSYTMVAIHKGRLATIKSGDKDWTYIECEKTFNPNRVTLSDIVFHKGLVYALDHRCKIFSFDVNSRPVKMRIWNLKDLPQRNTVEEQYNHSYIVESTSGEDLYVIRKQTEKEAMYRTRLFKVMKLEFHPEKKGSRVRVVESLNGDTVFVSTIYSTAVKASNFAWCEPNSIYFTDEFYWRPPHNEVEDSVHPSF